MEMSWYEKSARKSTEISFLALGSLRLREGYVEFWPENGLIRLFYVCLGLFHPRGWWLVRWHSAYVELWHKNGFIRLLYDCFRLFPLFNGRPAILFFGEIKLKSVGIRVWLLKAAGAIAVERPRRIETYPT